MTIKPAGNPLKRLVARGRAMAQSACESTSFLTALLETKSFTPQAPRLWYMFSAVWRRNPDADEAGKVWRQTCRLCALVDVGACSQLL